MAKSERFIIDKVDYGSVELGTLARIIVDKKTGVNYLFVTSGHAGGLTPLLDKDGKPIVEEINAN